MSAIWGFINKKENISQDIDSLFVNEYKRKCKIDKYQAKTVANVYMGCGIQYITKASKNESLPIIDKERDILFTADCILDNHADICNELNVSIDTPDGLLMYKSYLKWGIACLPKFRGIFSFALYDINRNKLILATDQTASRCLYYHISEDNISFSTLISPLKMIDESIKINELYIKDYLTAPGLMPNIVSNETPYSGIYKINNGIYIEIENDIVTEHEYWNPSIDLWNPGLKGVSEYGKHFKQLFQNCVSDTINVDGEIGIAMSSGFDSASVGVLAGRLLSEKGKQLYSYTYVPSDKSTVNIGSNNITDETRDVMSIVDLYDNIVPSFLTNSGKNCIEAIDDELDFMEIPFKAFVNLPNLCEIYSEAAKKGCKVVLVGQFGNSTVSHGYIDDVLFDLYKHKHFLTFGKYLNQYSKTVKESRKKALIGCCKYFNYSKKVEKDRSFDYIPTNAYLTGNILNNYPIEQRNIVGENYYFKKIPTSSDFYRKMIYKRAMYTYLGELETKIGLKYGIVVRDPTEDIRMLSFCYHLPYRYFAYNGIPRWLIRENMKDLLPKTILDNWLRYGVQNADYLSRIERDWDKLSELLCNSSIPNNMKTWIDTDKLNCFWKDFHDKDYSLKSTDLDDAVYVYICARFIAQNMSQDE